MKITNLKQGMSLHGFDVISVKELPEYSSSAIMCIHKATGCELFHMMNEDRENLFSFAFKTPPKDNTGVTHILEHSVLCGSKRFPLKDPFVVLLKSSMQTFLNAMTFPDKTIYPASSLVEKDFFNLLLVYGDAVFFPLLREEVFMQEAHHLEFIEKSDELKRVGVVLNEMKGALSSPETVVACWAVRSLLPDTAYGFESGGDPHAIPDLDYEGLLQFHRQYYHPSNCRIFLYGNVPTQITLQFLEDNFLSRFDRKDIKVEISLQKRWIEPKRIEKTYPGRTDQGDRCASVTLNWLTVPVTDPFLLLSFEVLSEILIGNPGSPLQKALLESELGEDISPSTGIDTELKEVVFSVGLRGARRENREDIENLILSVLKGLKGRGIDQELIQAAIHQVEFRNREIKRGGRPYSLKLMRKALRGWMHGMEPEETLEFHPYMEAFKQRLLNEERFLQDLIGRYLLDNTHRTNLLVEPDAMLEKCESEREQSEMENLKNSLSDAERQDLIKAAHRLSGFQEQADSPENLKQIPNLKREDLPVNVEKIPTEQVFDEFLCPVYFHNLFTNGIVYLDIVFDTSGIDQDLFDLIPLFGSLICGSGLPGEPYYDLARRKSLVTGGFGSFAGAGSSIGSTIQEHLIFRVKMLEGLVDKALPLIWELLLHADFQDLSRVEKIILEKRNDMKASLIPAGHQYVSLRAGSRISKALMIEEHWKGISQIFMLIRLTSNLKEKLPEIADSLNKLRDLLIVKNRLILNITAEKSSLIRIKQVLLPLVPSLPSGESPCSGLLEEELHRTDSTRTEALTVTSEVGYVAQAMPASLFGTQENTHEMILGRFLTTGFLWEQVRMKGGAYGAFAYSQGLEELFIFSSYRDPNISKTLKAYRTALIKAGEDKISEDMLEKTIIGAVGSEEKPLAPGEKGYVAFKRMLLGITDEMRQKRRDEIIKFRDEDLYAAAKRLLDSFDRGYSVILSSPRAVNSETDWDKKPAVIEIPE